MIGVSCAGAIAAAGLAGQASEERFVYPEGEEIRQGVARVSLLSGSVSSCRGDDPGVWRKAAVNAPLTSGDRLFAGKDGRVELELPGGNLVTLAPRTELSLVNVGGETRLAVRSGVASFSLRRVLEEETFEVDTPAAAVTLRAGDYRIEVAAAKSASALVVVRRGAATAAAGGGELPVGPGQQLRIEGRDSPRYDFEKAAAPDAWDRRVEERAGRFREVRSSAYVQSEVVGAADLDEFGRWENTPDYGNAWTPSKVDKDWEPYRSGHWLWQDPWGWTFVGEEPWGWAPYHYGRWAVYPSGWFWVPDSPTARYVAYAPALVAFLGGGADGTAAEGFHGGGDVGWFPLALQDPFYPWWIPRLDVHLTSVRRSSIGIASASPSSPRKASSPAPPCGPASYGTRRFSGKPRGAPFSGSRCRSPRRGIPFTRRPGREKGGPSGLPRRSWRGRSWSARCLPPDRRTSTRSSKSSGRIAAPRFLPPSR